MQSIIRMIQKYPLYTLLLVAIVAWGVWSIFFYTERKHAVRAEGMMAAGTPHFSRSVNGGGPMTSSMGESLYDSEQADALLDTEANNWANANPGGVASFANVDNLISADFQQRINIMSPVKRNMNMQERADPIIDGIGQGQGMFYRSTIEPGPRQGIDISNN